MLEILQIHKEVYNPTLLNFSLAKNCSDKIVSFLIDYVERDNFGPSAIKSLFLALNRETTLIFEKLLLKGGNIDAKTECGLTLLHEAVENRNLESVCLLLFYNASVNERDYLRRSPFELAVMINDYSIAQHLIEYVDDFNCDSYEGFTVLHMALRNCPEIAIDIIEKGGDVNVAWHETHCILLCLWWDESSEVFEAIWPRIDFQIFSTLHDIPNFFETFVSFCKFPDDEFLKCLYMVLESPHSEQFFDRTDFFDRKRSLLFTILERDLSRKDRTDVVATLLSYGIEIFFNDVCFLYEMYGFDDCVQMILRSGCRIYRNNNQNAYINPIVSKICYNSFDIYTEETVDMIFNSEHYLSCYGQFYKISYDNTFKLLLMKEEPEVYATNKVQSLVQLSRDIVRNAIYKSQCTHYSFNVYQAFSQLPVPLEIRDILFLKRAIY